MKIAILLCAVLTLLALPAAAIEPLGARSPSLSPDGRQLAFSWRGDIWIVPAEGGPARRLTDHVAHETAPVWSPDGSEIAFTSDRHGNGDIFVVGVVGGTPERLTYHSDWDWVSDWHPTNMRLYFHAWREERSNVIWSVAREGDRPVRVTGDLAWNAKVSPDGKWLVYLRGYTNWWRKHYRGPASRDLWIRALDGGESFHIVSWEGDDDRPHWSGDGRALFFQSEREDGMMNLYRQDLAFSGNQVRPAGPPVQLTHIAEDGLQSLNVSRNGQWAAFEWQGGLYRVATTGGEPIKTVIDCPGDLKANEVTRRVLTSEATEFAFAPGEKQIAFVVQGEIYAALMKDDEMMDPIRLTETDAREMEITWLNEETLIFVSDRHGDDDIFLMRSSDEDEKRLGKSRYRQTVRLTDSPETERRPQVSPDGKQILYTRDIRFLWTMKPDGTDQEMLSDEPAILHSAWSPDSRYVAYSVTNLGHAEDIFVLDTKTGEARNVSNHPNDDFHPLWTNDGKRLSWASRTDEGGYHIKYLWLTHAEADKSAAEREREEEAADDADDADEEDEEKEQDPIEVKIDWDDLPERTHTVATVRGFYWDYDASPDGKHYALRTAVIEEMELWTVDWDGDHLRRRTHGGADPRRIKWSEDSEKVRYLSGGRIQEIKNEDGSSPTTYSFSVELTVDARARRLQKFSETWRLLNDGFYDGNFHGTDWPAMRAKYEPLAEVALMKEDFNDVLREMIGELNASHLGIYGPGAGGGDQTGQLGFRADEEYQGPGVRVAKVLRHGPLDREGRRVEAGEVILAINGRAIEPGENYFPLLNHKVDEEVDLLVKGRKERTVTIEPADDGRIWQLAYRQWMDENRTMVAELSSGRLGYLHMSAMGDGDWDRFVADIFSRAGDKDGLILDVRDNNGGSIHDQVLTFLSRRAYCYSKDRGKREITYNALWRWEKPIVLLTNERSYSDGEIFPWGFKALGLGKIVGMPTFGAVIGTNDVELIDGTGCRVPGTGWYRMDGRNLENDPVQPDVIVPDVPEESLRGRDAQIEAGVRVCMEMLGG